MATKTTTSTKKSSNSNKSVKKTTVRKATKKTKPVVKEEVNPITLPDTSVPVELSNSHVITPITNPTQFQYINSYLLNFPFSLSTGEANNVWMEEMKDRGINYKKAFNQWMNLYNYLSNGSLIYVLPTPQVDNLQDLVYTANLGIAFPHLKNEVVISNFTSLPRVGETKVGVDFFKQMGYNVQVSPHKFEGEADLKHLYDNIYIGGYGQRSDYDTYKWMEKEYGCKIIKVYMADKYLYHLDCSIFPVNKEDTMICSELFSKQEIKQIEKYTNIIDLTVDDCYSGITNNVRHHNVILNASNLWDLKQNSEEYKFEKVKNFHLEEIANKLGMGMTFINIDEFTKSGALLSCLVMHLNRNSYNIDLL